MTNSGYVLQLATPYYEELTVRENLTLAAQMRLSSNFTMDEKFERVEQVMHEVLFISKTESHNHNLCFCTDWSADVGRDSGWSSSGGGAEWWTEEEINNSSTTIATT